jgi:hypothetical protein
MNNQTSMKLLQLPSPTTLDHQVWLLETIEQLRAQNFDGVNWEFLLEKFLCFCVSVFLCFCVQGKRILGVKGNFWYTLILKIG